MSTREADLGWIAGFFDGEGHVSYKRSRPDKKHGRISPILAASVPQKSDNREVLDFFQSVVGFGKIYGPYTVKTHVGTVTKYDLKFRTREIQPLFEILRPNLKLTKTMDFMRAIREYNEHDPYMTKDDEARIWRIENRGMLKTMGMNTKDAAKMMDKGCPRCGKGWNGVLCLNCFVNSQE